ncbi:MAG TPA: hypothetical protein ENN60_02980 [archaeon]|nr:hypothetical protein [archaeon]
MTKGQLTLEFLVITLLAVAYLTATLGLYKVIRQDLEKAVDKQVLNRVENWAVFVAGRPAGTQLKLPVKIYAGRWIGLDCGENIWLETPTTRRPLNVTGTCLTLNLTGDACLSITAVEGGLDFEEC